MTLRFACGHTLELSEAHQGTPQCGCGETRIARVQARAPRFVGVATGPYAEFKNLGPATVQLAPGGSLAVSGPKD